MCCGKKIITGISLLLTIGIFITQIGFGVHYVHNPVKCERSEFLTFLTLAGGCSGLLSIVVLAFCCFGCSCNGLKSSNTESDER